MTGALDHAPLEALRTLLALGVEDLRFRLSFRTASEIAGSGAGREAAKALAEANYALCVRDLACGVLPLPDVLAAILDLLRPVGDALARLEREGYDITELCRRDGAAERDLFAAMARRDAEECRRVIVPQWARWSEDTLDHLASRFHPLSKRGQVIRRALDVLHELQKFYGSGWQPEREAEWLARLDIVLSELARVGFDTIRLDLELRDAAIAASKGQRAASRAKRPASAKGAKRHAPQG